jgi:hypothetical protein
LVFYLWIAVERAAWAAKDTVSRDTTTHQAFVDTSPAPHEARQEEQSMSRAATSIVVYGAYLLVLGLTVLFGAQTPGSAVGDSAISFFAHSRHLEVHSRVDALEQLEQPGHHIGLRGALAAGGRPPEDVRGYPSPLHVLADANSRRRQARRYAM